MGAGTQAVPVHWHAGWEPQDVWGLYMAQSVASSLVGRSRRDAGAGVAGAGVGHAVGLVSHVQSLQALEPPPQAGPSKHCLVEGHQDIVPPKLMFWHAATVVGMLMHAEHVVEAL